MFKVAPKPPQNLYKVQEWFAAIITHPLCHNGIDPTAPSGHAISEEAKQFISPSPLLKSHERIQIYNQQYWWRLFNTLQEFYPLVLRLFNYDDFNQSIVRPYLDKFPPNHWSINTLGDQLPNFISKYYHQKDRALVLQAAKLDHAFKEIFYKQVLPPLKEVGEEKIFLQPHVKFLKMPFDLFTFREEMLKQEPDFWIDNPFPELIKGKFYFILYRGKGSFLNWRAIQRGEYEVLKRFQKGATLDEICEWLEEAPLVIQQQAEQNLGFWLKIAAEKELFTS